jgi:hypothetical protein
MNRHPFPSSPPSHPSPYRYLGGGGGERPIRLQIVIALVAGLVLVAVPLYLWRRPRPESIPSADAAIADAGALTAVAASLPIDAGPPPLEISPFTTIRCQSPGPGKTPPDRCDRVMFFEDALARAIRENAACAPETPAGGTVSFVLDMDFRRKKYTLYAGKSGTIPKSKTKDLVRCVKRSMPTPDWKGIPHQYSRYTVNVVATYPPSATF